MEKNDLIELARICLKHARATSVQRAAAALKRMARDYQRRAGLLGKDPSSQGNRARRRRSPIANDCSGLSGAPGTIVPVHAPRGLHRQ